MNTVLKVIIGFIIGGLVGFLFFGDDGIGIEFDGKLILGLAGALIALVLDKMQNKR